MSFWPDSSMLVKLVKAVHRGDEVSPVAGELFGVPNTTLIEPDGASKILDVNLGE